MRNIKALSEVIGIVLMVVITISLVAIASITIKSLIKQASLSPEISCIDLQIKNVLSIKKACYNEATKDVELLLKKSSAETEINDLKFIIAKGESKTFSCSNCNNCIPPKSEEIKTYYFQFEETPEEIAVIVNNCFIEEKNIEKC